MRRTFLRNLLRRRSDPTGYGARIAEGTSTVADLYVRAARAMDRGRLDVAERLYEGARLREP